MAGTTERLLTVETMQTAPMRGLFDSLKEVVSDTNILFTPAGIKIVTFDGTKIVLVHLFLEAGEFERYECNEDEILVGVNVDNLARLIKQVTNDDALTLYIDRQNKNVLGIRIESSTKKEITEMEYRVLDVDYEGIEINDYDPVCRLTMPSIKLLGICRNLNVVGEVLEFICQDDQFTICCTGDCATVRKMLYEDGGNVHLESNRNIPISARYDMKFITMFTKATPLSNRVTINIDKDGLLLIAYTVAKLGRLKFILSPLADECMY